MSGPPDSFSSNLDLYRLLRRIYGSGPLMPWSSSNQNGDVRAPYAPDLPSAASPQDSDLPSLRKSIAAMEAAALPPSLAKSIAAMGLAAPPANSAQNRALVVGSQTIPSGGPIFSSDPPPLQAGAMTPPWLGWMPVSFPPPPFPPAIDRPPTPQPANDQSAAIAECHAHCVEQTVDRGLHSGAPLAYRRCMRECLAARGIYDY